MKYKCSCCGKEHDSWPAISFSSPTQYNELSEEEKNEQGKLSPDFCEIKYADGTDRFIRCTLTLKVIDHCENLEYGIWVSLSEKSFADYSENYDNPEHEAQYFGWFCSSISDYENSLSIPTTVRTRPNNQRPEVIPHEDFVHPLVTDYYNGISKAEAEKRIEDTLRITGAEPNQTP